MEIVAPRAFDLAASLPTLGPVWRRCLGCMVCRLPFDAFALTRAGARSERPEPELALSEDEAAASRSILSKAIAANTGRG